MLDVLIGMAVMVWILGLAISIPFSRRGFKQDFRWANSNPRLIFKHRVEWTLIAMFWPIVIGVLVMAMIFDWLGKKD